MIERPTEIHILFITCEYVKPFGHIVNANYPSEPFKIKTDLISHGKLNFYVLKDGLKVEMNDNCRCRSN